MGLLFTGLSRWTQTICSLESIQADALLNDIPTKGNATYNSAKREATR